MPRKNARPKARKRAAETAKKMALKNRQPTRQDRVARFAAKEPEAGRVALMAGIAAALSAGLAGSAGLGRADGGSGQ